ncbi:hypothetical protein G3H63_15585 [Microbacterium resistens]|uniref:hypothetical protein n=1 Tax=Microbacterium resistens TaxID=156977 RepID=UPI001C588D54|nr:hypothetical protein [Microbacterium resistens]MBW1640486.1 hypothetical protein [Microbacterium resistens]
MEPAQLIALIISSGAGGGVVMKLLDLWKDARVGAVERRRAEVDRAFQERDRAIQERDEARAEVAAAEDDVDAATTRARLAEESLSIHRRVIIDAPCLGPAALPPFLPRKD